VVRAFAGLPALFALASGCATEGLDAPAEPTALDPSTFRCRVEPVLLARCAFFACHGSALRPFRVYAPERLRLDVPAELRLLPLTEAEEQANYDMALGFADPATGAQQLLTKPLAVEAGGAYHGGALLYGGEDVFSDRADPGYVLLAEWIEGATAASDCVPTEEVGP
jgi:hypothetical protein